MAREGGSARTRAPGHLMIRFDYSNCYKLKHTWRRYTVMAFVAGRHVSISRGGLRRTKVYVEADPVYWAYVDRWVDRLRVALDVSAAPPRYLWPVQDLAFFRREVTQDELASLVEAAQKPAFQDPTSIFVGIDPADPSNEFISVWIDGQLQHIPPGPTK